jgi:hypothetical protein
VLGLRDSGGAPCAGVRELVGVRLDQLNRRIEELLALRDELRLLLQEWDMKLATSRGERVHLLETLDSKSLIERARRERQPPFRTRRISSR